MQLHFWFTVSYLILTPILDIFIREDHFHFRGLRVEGAFSGVLSGYGVAVGTWVGLVRVSWMVFFQDCFLELGAWGWGLRVTWMIFRIVQRWFSWVGAWGVGLRVTWMIVQDGFLGLGMGGGHG